MKEFELTEENFADCVDAATGKPLLREGDVVLPERVIYNGDECKFMEKNAKACQKFSRLHFFLYFPFRKWYNTIKQGMIPDLR